MSALPPIPQDVDISTQLRGWMMGMLTDSIGYDAAIIALQGNRKPRNLIINGGLQVWQRGTSFASAAAQVTGPDRFQFARGAFALGGTLSRQASGLTGAQYCARMQRNAADASVAGLFFAYSMETLDAIPLAGQKLTLSFQARKGANYSGGVVSVVVRTGTGTDQNVFVGGGYTGNNDFASGSATLTTSYQRFSFTGTTLANTNELGFFISYTPTGVAGAADYIEIANVQLEIAPAFTVFDTLPFAETLLLCQRYYQKSFPYATTPAQNTALFDGVLQYQATRAGVNTTGTMLPMKTPMRNSTPTFTFYNPGAANALWRNRGTVADSGAASIGTNGEAVNYILNPQVAGDLVGNNIAIHWQADGEL
jgi:hypothetical protein